MRKKLDTRFPAARIKKIMQTDEDVGKIAMAVPLLVSKALELFLQDLCDRTYDITLRRGAKTMSSFHLKQCVQTFTIFDFLKDVVQKVPDSGSPVDTGDDHTICKRRKVVGDSENSRDDEARKKMREPGHSGRGRGRGRGKGQGRGSRSVDQEMAAAKFEDRFDALNQNGDKCIESNESQEDLREPEEAKEVVQVSKMEEGSIRNFDLNLDLDENGDLPAVTAPIPVGSPAKRTSELKHEEFPRWSLSDGEKIAVDPMQLTKFNRRMDEDEEDYDEES